MEWITKVKRMGACLEAIKWGNQFDTIDEAWEKCERGDWMLWLAGKLSGEPETDSRRKLVLCACECARLALPYVAKGEIRPLKAIETAEAWARGDESITLEMVRVASYAASYAAYAAYPASYAAYPVSYAASYAADAAAYAAYAASYAAYAAAYAANAATDAARTSVLKQCADIVRKYYPVAPEI